MIALGWALSLVALPSKHDSAPPVARGTILLDVSPDKGFQVNLSGFGGKHYLAMKVMAEAEAHDTTWLSERAKEPLIEAKLSDAVLKVASHKTKADLDDSVGKDVFREELRTALDERLFPVQVGDESGEGELHPKSGLFPGSSIDRATMRGSYGEHSIEVNPTAKTVKLDSGEPVPFTGTETDLEVKSSTGETIYVDVSRLDPDFHGKVQVGVLGSVRSVYFTGFLIQ